MRVRAQTLADRVTDFSFLFCLSGFKPTLPCIPVTGALEGGTGKGMVGNPDTHICPLLYLSGVVTTRRSRNTRLS